LSGVVHRALPCFIARIPQFIGHGLTGGPVERNFSAIFSGTGGQVDTQFDDRIMLRYARAAGVMYLLIIVIYMTGSFLSSSLHAETFAATAQSISESEQLYRISLLLMLLGSLLTIFLAGALYAFLKRVDPNLAMFALLFRVCEAVLGGTAKIALFTRLGIFTGTVAALSLQERSAISNLVKLAYDAGFNISVLFFSFGSMLFFYLLLTSRFMPRALSMFGIFASVSATVVGLINLIDPDMSPGGVWWTPMFIAEIATGLWLLVKGIDLDYWKRKTAGNAQEGSIPC